MNNVSKCRAIDKGKKRLESSPHDNDTFMIEDNSDGDDVNEWNEDEIKLALSKSWYVLAFFFFQLC